MGTREIRNLFCQLRGQQIHNTSASFALLSYFNDSMKDLPEKYGFTRNLTFVNSQGLFLFQGFENLFSGLSDYLAQHVTDGQAYWTGSNPDGSWSPFDCDEWRAIGCENGLGFLNGTKIGCKNQARLLCLGLNGQYLTSPAPTTLAPSNAPSTSNPSVSPTHYPSQSPSRTPTKSPTTSKPTKNPSKAPTTSNPTKSPTVSAPTKAPTVSTPSKNPTKQPTKLPTKSPSVSTPTKSPTHLPTKSPVTLNFFKLKTYTAGYAYSLAASPLNPTMDSLCAGLNVPGQSSYHISFTTDSRYVGFIGDNIGCPGCYKVDRTLGTRPVYAEDGSTQIANTLNDMFKSNTVDLLNPIQSGQTCRGSCCSGQPGWGYIWTGFQYDGTTQTSCVDWSSSSSGVGAWFGVTGGVHNWLYGFVDPVSCSAGFACYYCLEFCYTSNQFTNTCI